ncbi:hypothetical protein EUGRSUZ_E00599 [Eucalyptus grandis]|uniref:Uncharacterized protein n=2 Tax=Eucalyptus grandis TaxID=71139 RepID=A0ACC3KS38_EUCGR|nr:hypothetical protein EUGRSUZ_E00599 [Eucalyptus grandis]
MTKFTLSTRRETEERENKKEKKNKREGSGDSRIVAYSSRGMVFRLRLSLASDYRGSEVSASVSGSDSEEIKTTSLSKAPRAGVASCFATSGGRFEAAAGRRRRPSRAVGLRKLQTERTLQPLSILGVLDFCRSGRSLQTQSAVWSSLGRLTSSLFSPLGFAKTENLVCAPKSSGQSNHCRWKHK